MESWIEIPEKFDRSWSRLDEVKHVEIEKSEVNKGRRKSKVLEEYEQVVGKVNVLMSKAKRKLSTGHNIPGGDSGTDNDKISLQGNQDKKDVSNNQGRNDICNNQGKKDGCNSDGLVDKELPNPISKFESIIRRLCRNNAVSDSKWTSTNMDKNVPDIKHVKSTSIEETVEKEEEKISVIEMSENKEKEVCLEIREEVMFTDILSSDNDEIATTQNESLPDQNKNKDDVLKINITCNDEFVPDSETPGKIPSKTLPVQDENLQVDDARLENGNKLSKIENEELSSSDELDTTVEALYTIEGESETDNLKKEKTKERIKETGNTFKKVVGLVRSAKMFKKHQRHKTFNYEKYIKFLELSLGHTGFSIGNVVITWNRVSFFIVVLITLVGVFAQNALLDRVDQKHDDH